jgi:hypothetical protein
MRCTFLRHSATVDKYKCKIYSVTSSLCLRTVSSVSLSLHPMFIMCVRTCLAIVPLTFYSVNIFLQGHNQSLCLRSVCGKAAVLRSTRWHLGSSKDTHTHTQNTSVSQVSGKSHSSPLTYHFPKRSKWHWLRPVLAFLQPYVYLTLADPAMPISP